MVFSSKSLRFKPPLEELRKHFYNEVKSFLGYPLTSRASARGLRSFQRERKNISVDTVAPPIMFCAK